MDKIPLCVDMDGTLTYTDTFYESIIKLIVSKPWLLFLLPIFILRGRAFLKQWVSLKCVIDVSLLPYNQKFLKYLKQEKNDGRKLILVTGSHIDIANEVSQHLKIFDDVWATENDLNLTGANKRNVLVEKYGEKGFDYAGNSHKDLKVWRHARKVIFVNGSLNLKKKS